MQTGGQIVLKLLSSNSNITHYAVVDGVNVIPNIGAKQIIPVQMQISYPLIQSKVYLKMQADDMHIPSIMREKYYRDVKKISKESFTNLLIESNTFSIPDTLKNSSAHTLILFGENETHNIKKSSRMINETLKHSQMYQVRNMNHSEFALSHPHHYVRLLLRFFKN